MRVLAITTIFPNAEHPLAAPYIRQQLKALSAHCDLDIWATIPWFPGASALNRFSYWKRDLTSVPAREIIDGLEVKHPRFLRLPRIGYPVAGALFGASLLPQLLTHRNKYDLIFAIWAYPDGAAAIMLGQLLGIPVVVEAIGSDLNVIAELPGAKQTMGWALPRAAGVVTVSDALSAKAASYGVDPARVHTVVTGVDTQLFRPRDRREARASCGLPEGNQTLLFIGRLSREKGVYELMEAFDAQQRHDLNLVWVGDGPAKADCQAHADRHPGQISLTGEIPLDQLPNWIASSDLLVLPSYREGTPNVVIEALVSGRRVVASDVGGIPKLITDSRLGQMVPAQDASALANALKRELATEYDPEAVVKAFPHLSWPENASKIYNILKSALRS
jgi:teichuronic acid biosynthesis glycosyltransferase TuaC